MNLNELPLEHGLLTDRNIAIKLVGVGGAGANAVDRLKMENLERLQLAVINTDYQALASSPVQDKVLIGMSVTRGLGAGGDPELGREAAEADREKIANVVKDCDLVFLVTGMGGGTGSGASPIVAEIAAEAGALVIAFVTMPFSFEGGRRLKQAEEGLRALRQVCDAVIPLPNDVLLQEAAENETVLDSFARADEWIGRGVKSIWSMLFKTGLINLDFATLRQAFQHRGGKTLFGLGEGQGENAIADTIASLKMCPLLHTPEFSRKADRLLVNIVGGADLTLPKVNELMNAVTEQFGRDSHIIMGAVIDETLAGRVEVCVIGTSDMGGRSLPPRRPVTTGRTKTPAVTPKPEVVAATTLPGLAEEPVAKHPGSPKAVAQEEFGFGEIESRGYFEKTERNLFDGQDLDVPTYLRRGIKIVL
ncbi:MAG TPA: cell division protein FtsZ [Opitutaceae bacterium]|nr:cell division protein FtsZ [Opitutaceae bacterium]